MIQAAPTVKPARRYRWVACPVCDGAGAHQNRASGHVWDCGNCRGVGSYRVPVDPRYVPDGAHADLARCKSEGTP